MQGFLQTGQKTCHDTFGNAIPCAGSGQDAEFKKGIAWPDPRFEVRGDIVLDLLTRLFWTLDVNIAGYPLTWQESLDYISDMNTNRVFGYDDWRLPNRRELRSLMSHQTKKPALSEGHPFRNIFLGWYWTSTTAAINPVYAWYIHLEGARMFYGNKNQYFLLWPVRDRGNSILPATGQTQCFDSNGHLISCAGTGQDGEYCHGKVWPEPRFNVAGEAVVDHLTGLCWLKTADLTGGKMTWIDALKAVAELNRGSSCNVLWRVPNINELESLVDCTMHSPALPEKHPFRGVREGYWSSTTSMFEPDWAWALYLTKGAIGVGQKWGSHFYVWPVRDASGSGYLE
jgi:hypothetical protein